MGKKEDYKKMLKDKSFIFTPENEVVPNEYNPNKDQNIDFTFKHILCIAYKLELSRYIMQILCKYKNI